ncbi:MAG: divalent metal cation transporter, partial [Thaumarchaeota archaeon]|nr:divalent metal cation transporter [Nitrososphaerota archaeon]
ISAALSVFGGYASIVMGIGFIAAGFLALVVVSLGSAWGIMDALNRRSRNSFIKIYLLESAPALLLVILVNNYVSLMITLMVIYTIIIIPSLFFLGRLTSNKECMNGKPLKRYETAVFWVMSLSIVVAGITGIALIV